MTERVDESLRICMNVAQSLFGKRMQTNVVEYPYSLHLQIRERGAETWLVGIAFTVSDVDLNLFDFAVYDRTQTKLHSGSGMGELNAYITKSGWHKN
ncbi:hypothetical protein LU11_gp388 [Pseudomonas phage Lu11]|uniref:hypothetical protein n=1 Tax=Pseudomonas phage Lu11 TaxID=1161927 RepID=UPI00025F18E1|nr:hypothetical protein LU11_gp388 [Pseudomonas phage Lu11]AFH14919.1 hypothetical protein Lu11_0381 [Pseudomonas phage Lu11]